MNFKLGQRKYLVIIKSCILFAQYNAAAHRKPAAHIAHD
jgi:hypothetical protein